MCNRPAKHAPPQHSQRGGALIVAMLLLAIMLSLGVGSMESALVEQRSAGALRDVAVAFESAEFAALEALDQVRKLTENGKGQPDGSTRGYYMNGTVPNGGATPVSSSGPGLSEVSSDFWATTDIDPNTNATANKTQVSALVAKPGAYIIERLEDSQEGEPASANSYYLNYSRITVRAAGQKEDTKITLQANYIELPN